MSKHCRICRVLAALIPPSVMVLSLAAAAVAGDKPPVKFAPGSDSASLKGDIQGMDRDIYPITAKAGQTMQVKVTNKRKLVLFHIQKPGKEEAYLPKAGEEDDATEWKGVLPASGTYKIIVGAMRGDDTSYVLDVRITK
jgi:hypothetical protein